MPSDRFQQEPESPGRVSRIVSAVLVLASAIAVFAFPAVVDRPMGLPERLNAAIIGLGALAGVLHMLGVAPRQRHLKAFAGPAVAWPVMAAGIAALITS